MTRRDASWLIARAAATAGAASFLSPWLAAQQMTHHHVSAPADPHNWNSYKPAFFSAEQFRWLQSFTEILIPTDETPGAKDAHVAEFIDFVVNAAKEYAPEVQAEWRKAFAWLELQKFSWLTGTEKFKLISSIAESETNPGPPVEGYDVYRLIKEMTVRAFYTSRVGLVDELEYQGIGYLKEFPACNHPEHQSV